MTMCAAMERLCTLSTALALHHHTATSLSSSPSSSSHTDMDMAGRHRARKSSIQVRDAKIVKAGVRALKRSSGEEPVEACSSLSVKPFLVRQVWLPLASLASLAFWLTVRPTHLCHIRFQPTGLEDQVPSGPPHSSRHQPSLPHDLQDQPPHHLLLLGVLLVTTWRAGHARVTFTFVGCGTAWPALPCGRIRCWHLVGHPERSSRCSSSRCNSSSSSNNGREEGAQMQGAGAAQQAVAAVAAGSLWPLFACGCLLAVS